MTDVFFMRQALDAARQSLYITSPNPRVGCVIVLNNQVVASGATQIAGGPHAEIVALQQAKQQGIDTQSSTIYVTLEPCSHYGRTAPCVLALIAAKPKRVVIAMLDPNPQVAGKGVAALKAAGIEVTIGVEMQAALELNIGFVSRMVRGRPWVWLKTASSLDGRTALPDGRSKWITGAQARLDGQRFRARSCVVLTGIGTVLDDDPQLNVRDIDTVRQPIRAIVDSQLRLDLNAKIIDGQPIWVFTTRQQPEKIQALAAKNVRVIVLPATVQGQVDLQQMMHWISEQAVNEIHVEAGATLNGALFSAGYVDAVLSYIAPMVLGEGRPLLGLPTLNDLADAPRFEFIHSKQIGADMRLIMRQPTHYQQLIQQLQQLHV